jgi:hypothetical protein
MSSELTDLESKIRKVRTKQFKHNASVKYSLLLADILGMSSMMI